MTYLIVLFNLKTAASIEAYETWANATDVPTVTALASVDSFKVFKNLSVLGSEDAPPYQYVEVIAVNDMDGLGTDIGTETMQRVSAEFQAFADNPIFMISSQIA